MRVLILGVGGMLGHRMLRTFQGAGVDVWGTVRKPKSHYSRWEFLQSEKVLGDVDVTTDQLTETFDKIKPDWIINCVGLTLRKEKSLEPISNITLNALLPHKIELWCRSHNATLIHYSTDCVFNGVKGGYSEDSLKDACDVYGQSKSLGEVIHSKHAITFRSSIVGREIEGKTELIEWFLKQRNKTVNGYELAIYSGVTTNFMASLTLKVVTEKPDLRGLFQPTSQPISKYGLLELVNREMKLNIEVLPDRKAVVNHTLRSDKFREATGWQIPSWQQMVAELAQDASFYGEV